jgi:hypothetical protein
LRLGGFTPSLGLILCGVFRGVLLSAELPLALAAAVPIAVLHARLAAAIPASHGSARACVASVLTAPDSPVAIGTPAVIRSPVSAVAPAVVAAAPATVPASTTSTTTVLRVGQTDLPTMSERRLQINQERDNHERQEQNPQLSKNLSHNRYLLGGSDIRNGFFLCHCLSLALSSITRCSPRLDPSKKQGRCQGVLRGEQPLHTRTPHVHPL